MSFGFQPRIFDKGEIIYEEDQEAPEMYFIINGQIGVGYSLPGYHQTIQKYPLTLNKNKSESQRCCFIGDFYVTSNRKCEFKYTAITEVTAWSISRDFINQLFEKFPTQGNQIKIDSLDRHKRIVRKPLNAQRAKDLETLNNFSTYKTFEIVSKNNIEKEEKKIEENVLHNDHLQNKLDDILEKMGRFADEINNFAELCDQELDNLAEIVQNS